MVKEIVPLSKNFRAAKMGTAKQSNNSSVRLEASEFIDVELCSLRRICRMYRPRIKIFSF
jgi:hypothetical protein